MLIKCKNCKRVYNLYYFLLLLTILNFLSANFSSSFPQLTLLFPNKMFCPFSDLLLMQVVFLYATFKINISIQKILICKAVEKHLDYKKTDHTNKFKNCPTITINNEY